MERRGALTDAHKWGDWAILAPMGSATLASSQNLRRTVLIVALANLGYFFVEFAVARHIGSVSLFADSIDFLEDTAVNLLVFFALAWSAQRRARVGMVLAAVLLVPAVAVLWTAWHKFNMPTAPEPEVLSLTGGGALAVNLSCALLLARHRNEAGSLAKAAFFSARNDAFANLAIIAAGLITLRWVSGWPDLVVGLGIAAMNADAAKEVWETARAETRRVMHRA
jgi:Co/Zn/Cd efflux system component